MRTKRASRVGTVGAVRAELAAARRPLEQGTRVALREVVERTLAGGAAAAGGLRLHLSLREPRGVPGDEVVVRRQALGEGKAGEADEENNADRGGEAHGVGGA